jgi:putative copper resistance protein D
MLALADLLEGLLRGAVLTSLCLVLGSVVWALCVLRIPKGPPPRATGRCLALLGGGAVALALGQGLLLALKARLLSESLGRNALGDFVATAHFEAGALRVLLALAMAGAAVWLRRRPGARGQWAMLVALAGLLAIGGAWLTHASGRLENRLPLMAFTVAHQVAAAIWVGGLIQLCGLWRLTGSHPEIDARWPELVARFSRLALASVVVLVLVAIPLTWTYAGSLGGLIGTGYGSLVLIKAMLLVATLLLAAANFGAVRASAAAGLAALRSRLPSLAEAEAIVAIAILFAAAALSAQPPPADQTPAQQATFWEVVEVFRPKLPSLRTPSVEAMRRQRTAPPEGAERARDAYLWSNFSHNVAGLILLGMSLVALGGLVGRHDWRRQWPLGFVLLAAFVFMRGAANEGTWPFGTTPFWRLGTEGLQHRIAAVLVLALGALEWRARARPRPGARLPYVFPTLAALGAVLLLTHSHTAFQLKSGFLVQVTHTAMGALAALVAAARWLDLRLAGPGGRLAGVCASAAMLAIALILVFYREANVIVPTE